MGIGLVMLNFGANNILPWKRITTASAEISMKIKAALATWTAAQ